MSAKPSRKKGPKAESASSPAASAAGNLSAAMPAGDSTATAAAPAWIDSSDPRKRMIGKIVLIGVWIYVAALWLLALDQTFHWGIFGPKVPPVP